MSDEANHDKELRRFVTSSASEEVASRVRRDVTEYSEVMRSLEKSQSPLSAFCVKPSNLYFATQDSSEKVLLLLRKHPVTQLPWVLLAAIGLIIPLFWDLGSFLGFLPAEHQAAAVVAWYVALIVFVFEQFLSWYYNVNIITDERVIDIDFHSLIYRNISSTKLAKIEDVTATTHGVLGTIINYGTVTVQTAGEKREFEFENVPAPNTIVQLLNELLQEEELEQLEGRVA